MHVVIDEPRGRFLQAYMESLARNGDIEGEQIAPDEQLREAYLDYHMRRLWLKLVTASALGPEVLCRAVRYLVECMQVMDIVRAGTDAPARCIVDVTCAVRYTGERVLERHFPDTLGLMRLGSSFVVGNCAVGPRPVLLIRIVVEENVGRAMLRAPRSLWLLREGVEAICPLHLDFRIALELSPNAAGFRLDERPDAAQPALLGVSTSLPVVTAGG